MKQIIFLVSILCVTQLAFIVPAALPPQVAVTLEYGDYEYVSFVSAAEVDLMFITSSAFDHAAILAQKIAYYPSTNETKYKFTSLDVMPSSEYVPDVEDFFYQDLASGQIHIVRVDYSAVDVPVAILQQQYDELVLSYTLLSAVHNATVVQLANANMSMAAVDASLAAYAGSENLTNATLADIAASLYANYSSALAQLNNTLTAITTLEYALANSSNAAANVSSNYTSLQLAYAALQVNLTMLNEMYNTTLHALTNTSGLLSDYQTFESGLRSMQQQVYFKGRSYMTAYYAEKRIHELENDVGMTPIYVVIAIVVTSAMFFLFYRYKMNALPVLPVRIDSDYNYPKEAGTLDKFSMHGILKKKKPDVPPLQPTNVSAAIDRELEKREADKKE